MQLSILIKTSLGLESVTKAELRDLGYREVQTADGEIRILGGAEDVVRLNLALRTAERVLIEVGRFEANDFDALFDQAEALPWGEYLPETAKLLVDGATSRSELKSVRTAQSMIKRAVANVLQKKYGVSRLTESGAEYALEFFFLKSQVSLALNTSGDGLHRRGYRKEAGTAPLRETLAAALVILSGWDEQGEFSDPFCGSGTIPIEAALMQRRIAPGLHRSFAAESWPIIPENFWREIRAEFAAVVLPEGECSLVG
ncbi:MAG: class I SAM-dependent RNA methyltransferase, partial [Deltaproteobacteria bacterium]|nr:class I SAM-dependent RNA methyltransferase [Deltaproteobacteria bacterium]